MARLIGSPEIVESVLAHRSVATGEVSFGRSDLDLLMVVREPILETRDGPELAALYERVRLLRLLNPALGHIEIHDLPGLRSWIETDTYRGSMERRSALLLHGKAIGLPNLPVRRDHAVRRFAIWPDNFFSTAVRERNKRNMRKIALEMWNSQATATGVIPEPFLTRRETEAFCREAGEQAFLDSLTRNAGSAPYCVLELARRLHQELLPPLKPISRTIIFRARMAPRFRERTFVVLPEADSPLPPETYAPDSFLCTPEALNLYLHFANAFLYWALPPGLLQLGFRPPAPEEFVRSCRFYGHSHTIRNPGFMNPRSWTPAVGVAVLRHTVQYLKRGETPPPIAWEQIDGLLAQPPTFSDYYRRVYRRIHDESKQLWEMLTAMPDSTRTHE